MNSPFAGRLYFRESLSSGEPIILLSSSDHPLVARWRLVQVGKTGFPHLYQPYQPYRHSKYSGPPRGLLDEKKLASSNPTLPEACDAKTQASPSQKSQNPSIVRKIANRHVFFMSRNAGGVRATPRGRPADSLQSPRPGRRCYRW